jgi:hypothetical protein
MSGQECKQSLGIARPEDSPSLLSLAECFCQTGQYVEVLFCGISRYQQPYNQLDGSIIYRVKIKRLPQSDNRSQWFGQAVQATMR